MKIFISHIHEEFQIANTIKKEMDNIFGKQVNVFLAEDIPLGINWFSEIKKNLIQSDIILAIFSPYSANRPWVNIEAGFGIMSEKTVIPLLCLGLSKDKLPSPYHFQQFVLLNEKNDLIKLIDQIAQVTPAGRLLLKMNEIIPPFQRALKEANNLSIGFKPQLEEPPTVWIIGSHDSLEDRLKAKALHTVTAVAREFVRRQFRIVMGGSRLLEYMGDCLTSNLEKDSKLLAEASSEPLRKGMAQASAEENLRYPSPNPVVLLGSLRSKQGIRRIFLDSIGRVPDVALIFGGTPKIGRTLEEVKMAKDAKIPALPIKALGGAGAEITHSFDAQFESEIQQLAAYEGHVGEIGAKIADLVEEQTYISRS